MLRKHFPIFASGARERLPELRLPNHLIDVNALRPPTIAKRNTANALVEDEANVNTVIEMYDYIGAGGITAADIRRKLDKVRTETLTLRINSGGGDVFEGFAIYNDLRAYSRKVRVEVAGLAASAASLIAMAADEVVMEKSSFLMIHNAWLFAAADRHELRRLADVLEQVDAGMRDVYSSRSGKTAREVEKIMDAETWYSSEDAIAAGFADRVIDDPVRARATIYDMSACSHVPAAYKRRVEHVLRDEGVSATLAKRAVAQGFEVLRDAVPEPDQRDAELTASLQQLLRNLSTSDKGS